MGLFLLYYCGRDRDQDNLKKTLIVGDDVNNKNSSPEKIMGKKEDENKCEYLTKESLMEINKRNTVNTIRNTDKSIINLEDSNNKEMIYEEEGIITS